MTKAAITNDQLLNAVAHLEGECPEVAAMLQQSAEQPAQTPAPAFGRDYYCWSLDGETYHQSHFTRAAALLAGQQEAEETRAPNTSVRVFTGRQVSVIDVLRSSRFLGSGVLDLCEQLASDEIASDDLIIEVPDGKVAELAEVVLGWLSANATFKRWGVDAIEHDLYTTQPE
jgi:hypothetical protein